MAREYVHDTTILNGLDSLEQLLQGSNYQNKICRIITLKISKGELSTAKTKIDSLHLVDSVKYDLFCKLNSLLIELKQTVANCYSVQNNPVLTAKLDGVRYSSDYSDKFCYRATEIYNTIFGYNYQEPFPNFVKTHSMSNYKEPLDFSSLIDGSYSIYPSPASDVLTIETGTDEKITIKIFDITGKLMLSTQASTIATLNVSELSSGTYMVHMIYTDGTIKNDRFVKR